MRVHTHQDWARIPADTRFTNGISEGSEHSCRLQSNRILYEWTTLPIILLITAIYTLHNATTLYKHTLNDLFLTNIMIETLIQWFIRTKSLPFNTLFVRSFLHTSTSNSDPEFQQQIPAFVRKGSAYAYNSSNLSVHSKCPPGYSICLRLWSYP